MSDNIQEKLFLVKSVLISRCRSEEGLTSLERWFYTAKAILCVILGRKAGFPLYYGVTAGIYSVELLNNNFYRFENIVVSWGIAKNWNYSTVVY